MQRGLLIGVLLIAAWTAPLRASLVPVCGACIPTGDATTQGEPPIPAFFCVGAIEGSPQFNAAVTRCDGLGGDLLYNEQEDPSCAQQLLEADILCPGTAGVPAVASYGLTILAALLGGLGAFVLRRRDRRA